MLKRGIDMVEIFGDSFETGNYSLWTDKSGTDVLSIVTTDPHHGTYHAHAYCDGGATGEMAYLYKTLASTVATIYSRAYFKFLISSPSSGNSYNMLMHSYNSSSNICSVRLYNSGTNRWQLYYLNGGTIQSTSTYEPSPAIALNTWYCVELKTIVGDSGSNVLYINGNAIINVTGVDNNYYGNVGRIDMGERYSSGATAHSTYFDCVRSNSSYIGPESGGGGDPGIATYWEPAKVTSDPSTVGMGEGAIWFNTTSDTIKYYIGGGTVKTMTST
jgi:hypothetical protein